jgi:hypothetical protein
MLNEINRLRQSQEYRNYLEIRTRVLQMIDEMPKNPDHPSNYWREELAGFDYMLDASPLIISKLREHCYHLTGLRSYDYRTHHAPKSQPFVNKLEALKQLDRNNLLVPESSILGGFGYEIDGNLINADTLKFYECLIALNKEGILTPFRQNTEARKLVLEIGGGWGGFAYQFKTLCPNTCYVIVDFPAVFLFSAVYLKTLFPKARIRILGDVPHEKTMENWQDYDFIFVPHTYWDKLIPEGTELAINMASFQEMTTEQVDNYVHKIAHWGCPAFYSMNRERSPYNTQLSSVSTIIRSYYNIHEIKVLDVDYTRLSEKQTIEKNTLSIPGKIRKILSGGRSKTTQTKTNSYIHLIGVLN